jgi:hypothetical protein
MRSKRSLAATSLAGAVLALTFATGAWSSPLSCVACEVTTSYYAAVRAYDRARAWGIILRWWVDPEYGTTPARQDRNHAQSSPKTEDVCEAHPVPVQMQ